MEMGDMRKRLDEFKARYGKAKLLADQWSSLLQSCYQHAIPFRNKFYRPKQQQGEQKNSRLYDTTAVEATKTFVSKMHDAMTPPQQQWGYLELDGEWGNIEEADREEAQKYLDAYMRRLFKYIHRSNFDVVINECYFDLAVGTSCLVVNQYNDDNPLLFTSVPADKLCIEECFDGTVKTWFRNWEDIKISEVKDRWKSAQLTPDMETLHRENPNAKASIIYEGVLYMPNCEKPYCYAAWVDDGFLFYEMLDTNPAIVWRFQKTNNDIWGRGPVMDALPSIISLQEMARIELASANLNAFKPYMAFSDGVFNAHTFQLKPFSVIPIAPIGSQGQYPLIPLPDSSNPQFAQLTINDLRMQIRALLFSELAEESESIQPQSASEVMMRQQRLAKKIGPLFARIQHEFLEPVIARCAHVLHVMGILPKPMIDGKTVTFKYRSPLEFAQGQQDNGNFIQFMQMLQGIMGPDAAQMFVNPDQAPYLLAENMQIDPRFLQSRETMQMMAMAMKEQQAQMPAEGDEALPPEGAPG